MTPKEYTEYLNKNIISQVAARAGTNSAYLYQIGRGQRGCSPKLAVALEEASKHYARKGNDFMSAEEILNIDELRKIRAEEIKNQAEAENLDQEEQA